MALIRFEDEGAKAARLEKARAALSEASERVGAKPPHEQHSTYPAQATEARPRKAVSVAEKKAEVKAGFDRAAYQRAYMREWRARKRAKPTSVF